MAVSEAKSLTPSLEPAPKPWPLVREQLAQVGSPFLGVSGIFGLDLTARAITTAPFKPGPCSEVGCESYLLHPRLQVAFRRAHTRVALLPGSGVCFLTRTALPSPQG